MLVDERKFTRAVPSSGAAVGAGSGQRHVVAEESQPATRKADRAEAESDSDRSIWEIRTEEQSYAFLSDKVMLDAYR